MAKTFERLVAAMCLFLSVPAHSAVPGSTGGSDGSHPNLAKIAASRPATVPGQSATQLPDGRWLLLGGRDPGQPTLAGAKIVDANSGRATPLAHGLLSPRAGHTATLMPDGSILVLGGTDASGDLVDGAEQFSPETGRFTALERLGLIPRVHHSATVLTDGRLLIAGGVTGRGLPVYEAELYNPATQFAERFDAKLEWARLAHLAALLPSSKVLLWGGVDPEQRALDMGELFDPVTSGFKVASADEADQLAASLFGNARPDVVSTVPNADAIDVPVGQRLLVRFSKRMAIASLNDKTVTLLGPHGKVAVKVAPVEEGSLLFVTPQQQLLPASHYTLFIKGSTDPDGRPLPFTAVGWTTESLQRPGSGGTLVIGADTGAAAETVPTGPATQTVSRLADLATAAKPNLNSELMLEEWVPDSSNFSGNWRSRRSASPLRSLPPLKATEGTTALAGQVLTLHGAGLANVTLKIGAQTAQTDETGRFLLANVNAGRQVLSIDGNTVRHRGGQYGFYMAQVDIEDKKTNVLSYTIWLSRLDPAGNAVISSPTAKETVLTSPRIPGLELHIPPGTVIRDSDGKIVTSLNMTAIPTDRTPFPIPAVGVPVYFTVQPGGAVIENISGSKLQGAYLIYPNFSGAAPRTRIDFWNYDAREKGWYIYGRGTVTQDGKQVVPDPGVAIYEFTGAMISLPSNAPADGPPDIACRAGDPVDVYTGLFLHENVDLAVSDIVPLEVVRSYRPRDPVSRAFGIGTNLSYNIFIVGDSFPYTYVDLILPDGGRIHFRRTSPGTSFSDAVYMHPPTGSKYDGATIDHHSNDCYWQLKLKDGTKFCFPESFGVSNPSAAAPRSMTDRYGNTLVFTRDAESNLTSVTSSNGRSLQFLYDAKNRITQAMDNIGRQTTYEYDSVGRLVKATLPDGSFEAYTYDSNNNMATVRDQRGNIMVTNAYDDSNRVRKQTYADGKENSFAYLPDSNGKAQVDVTNERGVVARYAFDSNGSPASITLALGLPEQQVVRFERDANGLLLSQTDALGRKTSYTYDDRGNLTSKTLLAGTADATTVTVTYIADLNDPASITDPLGHKTVFSYDSPGRLAQVTDANSNVTRFSFDGRGLLTRVTDGLGKVYAGNYDGGDLVSITDPLNRSVSFDYDALGRGTGITKADGNRTLVSYDQLGRRSQLVDPLGNSRIIKFDANGNPIEVQDARGSVHKYVYDARNRQIGYTDPLQQTERYGYDGSGNLISYTDRKGQLTQFGYDHLDRLEQITHADGGTLRYSYDQGNRPIRIVDSSNGTITYTYDSYDRITSETTSKATVSYTYYSNSLRKTMTVSGQPTLRYTYDSGNRLVRIDQDAGAANNNTPQRVTFAYDAVDRRTQTTLPNGTTLNYSYDDAGQLAGIVYRNADGSELGDLSYAYDAAGQRINTGGSLARISLPDVSSGSVDTANRLTSWNGSPLTYDANGNLTNDGTNTYVWNARDQLIRIDDANGNVIASFTYDALGRRLSKTVNGKVLGYVYDGINAVQVLGGANVNNNAPGNVMANYITGLGWDEVYAALTATGGTVRIANYLTDALGSVIGLVDTTGAKLVDYTYDPYGKTSADGIDDNPFQYTGRENDGTGLYYYRARFYSPSLMRFISSDPIGLGGGINTYTYVLGNPVSYVDPSGKFGVVAAIGFGLAAWGAYKLWDSIHGAFERQRINRDEKHLDPSDLLGPNPPNANDVQDARAQTIKDAAKIDEAAARKLYPDPAKVMAKKLGKKALNACGVN